MNELDSLSSNELVNAVSKLKLNKQELTSQIQTLKKSQAKALENAYFKVLNLNEDQANKHFKTSDITIPFSERLDSSIKSLVGAHL